MDEEVVLLEEQLATAHADIERLQTQMAELAALDSRRDGELQTLRSQLEASRTEGDAARSELAAQSREALGRYREAVLQREPQLPAELVTGDTVSELESAVERARQTVAQVRQHLEQQAQALRVPAGAPARGSPDTSDLTAGEKIRLGLQKG
jgi:regulator of replication initiation timing